MSVIDSFRLDGKVAVVTGASSGLGVHFAQAPAEAGADVARGPRAHDRRHQPAGLPGAWTPRKGIRVNAIAPGFFKSEMTDEYRPEYVERQLKRVPAGRFGKPEEAAAAVVFLASDASGYVTGQTLVSAAG